MAGRSTFLSVVAPIEQFTKNLRRSGRVLPVCRWSPMSSAYSASTKPGTSPQPRRSRTVDCLLRHVTERRWVAPGSGRAHRSGESHNPCVSVVLATDERVPGEHFPKSGAGTESALP